MWRIFLTSRSQRRITMLRHWCEVHGYKYLIFYAALAEAVFKLIRVNILLNSRDNRSDINAVFVSAVEIQCSSCCIEIHIQNTARKTIQADSDHRGVNLPKHIVVRDGTEFKGRTELPTANITCHLVPTLNIDTRAWTGTQQYPQVCIDLLSIACITLFISIYPRF